MKVFVLTINHRFGSNVSVHISELEAKGELFSYVKELLLKKK